jgi:hypothetical protein
LYTSCVIPPWHLFGASNYRKKKRKRGWEDLYTRERGILLLYSFLTIYLPVHELTDVIGM